MTIISVVGSSFGWLKRNAWICFWSAISFVIGIMIRYPAGWELSDGNATMLAGLVGALATAVAVMIGMQLQINYENHKYETNQKKLRYRINLFMILFFLNGIILSLGWNRGLLMNSKLRLNI